MIWLLMSLNKRYPGLQTCPSRRPNPVDEFFKFRVSRENTFQFWIYLDDSAKLSRMLLTGGFKQINAKKRAICAILLMEPFLSYIEEYAF
jgi:hypothetical protein